MINISDYCLEKVFFLLFALGKYCEKNLKNVRKLNYQDKYSVKKFVEMHFLGGFFVCFQKNYSVQTLNNNGNTHLRWFWLG